VEGAARGQRFTGDVKEDLLERSIPLA